MATITKNTDGDTFRVDGTATRVLGINTDESVAVRENRNSQSGRDASAKAKLIAPTGTEVTTNPVGKGTFGRDLSDVTIQTAGGAVDYGLVALDQSMSTYNIDYGIHPDPEQHERFKEYYSENAPYQYSDPEKRLSKEDYASTAKAITEYAVAERQYEDGDITREEYESAMFNAYGDGDKVAAFRQQNHQWQRDFNMAASDGSDRMAYDWAHQSQENRDKYDRAVRNSHTGFRTSPEKSVGFWRELVKGTQTAFSAFNDFAVLGRAMDLYNAREYGDDEFNVSDVELTKGVPVEWHDKIMQEAEKYGDDAAVQYRDNLITSLSNEAEFAELPLATQIVTAIPAILTSPMTLLPGAKIAQGTMAATRTIDSVMKVGKLSSLAIPSKVAVWAAAGATEAGISAIPRLHHEDTFTSKDMLNEMKYGAAFGVAIPAVLKVGGAAVSRARNHSNRMDSVIADMQSETSVMVEQPRAEAVSTPEPTTTFHYDVTVGESPIAQTEMLKKAGITKIEPEVVVTPEAITAPDVKPATKPATQPVKPEVPRTPEEDLSEFVQEAISAMKPSDIELLTRNLGKSAEVNRINSIAAVSGSHAVQVRSKKIRPIHISRARDNDIVAEAKRQLGIGQPKPIHVRDVADEMEMSHMMDDMASYQASLEAAPVKAPTPKATPKATPKDTVKEVPKVEAPKPTTKALTVEDLNYLDNEVEGIIQTPKPKDEAKLIKDVQQASRKALQGQADARALSVLANHTMQTPAITKRAKVAQLGSAFKSFTQTMLESKSKVAQFIGDQLLELPQGHGGKIVRAPSAALQQHSLRTRYLSQTQPDYHKSIGQYAGEQGKKGIGKFMAQHMDGQSNKIAKQFSDDIARTFEQRRQGKPVSSQSPSVMKMVDAMESSMGKMFDDLVEAGVQGFKKDRRVSNYFPQLWEPNMMIGAVSKHGKDKVQRLLAKGYLSSKHNSINTMNEAMQQASNMLAHAAKGTTVDGAMPTTMDSRARTRLDIDSTVTDGQLSIMDFMETDFSTVTAKYTNRAAGQIALANKGIKSELDIASMRKVMEDEGVDAKELQLFDDTFDIIMGKPTRDGLTEATREVKDAVSLSKMGGLGMAQAAEAGSVIARSLMQLVNDPAVFKKIWAMAGESTDNVQLMRETQALSGISNDVHLLDRQSVHLDQNELSKITDVRDTVNYIAGKASFGKWKAPAGYILSQGSGFNMIRRFERRITNASFMLDTAKTFKDGTGVMSHDRMRDIGLDPNDLELKNVFKNIVEYDADGIVKKLNLDKWDKKVREKYHLAMYRDDAQMVQQTIGGEMPAWINNPAMTLVAQFKQSAILANNKQLGRNLQFADTETVLGTSMNIAMAALTRTAKFGTLGAAAYAVSGDESELQKPWELDHWQPEKYVSTFGFFPDMIHIGLDTAEAIQEERVDLKTAGGAIAGEIPVLGWMKDYYDLGTADSLEEKADAAKGVAILGNMQFADILYKGLEAQLED